MTMNEIVLFTDGNTEIEVQISPELETVWLTQKQMGELFGVKQATLSEHIKNIIDTGELDETSIGFSDKSSGGRKPKIYNLDMILSVGYRVNSKRGIAFRRWASLVLKQYTLNGYAINERRLQALQKTVEIQTKMIAGTLDIEQQDVLKAVWINMITSLLRSLKAQVQYTESPIVIVERWLIIWRIHSNQMYLV